jgi:NADH dehydrogenase
MEATVETRKVVIIGAGYAGLLAALRLAGRRKRLKIAVTLVNASDHFVDRIRLHQLATGRALQARPIARLLHGSGVDFVRGRVVALDVDRKCVAVETPEATRDLSYDHLLYALGSTVDTATVPGVREHADALAGEGAATKLAARLPELARQHGRVAVVGGGLTGIEAATEIAEAWPALRVSLVTRGRAGYGLSDKGHAHLMKVCARLGIDVHEGATVRLVEQGCLDCEGGWRLPFDVCLWAGSFSVASLARDAGLAVNDRGQILVDPYMRSISHPEILAAGDAAVPVEGSGVPIRMACATALPLGAHAADSLAAMLAGEPPRPFRFAYVFQCISLGRRDGIVQFVLGDDSPRERILGGRTAALFKEAICRSPMAVLKMEKLRSGSYRWPRGSAPPDAEPNGPSLSLPGSEGVP